MCVFCESQKLKPAGKNNKTAKDEQLGQTNQFSFNSSSLGYVRMLHGRPSTFYGRDLTSFEFCGRAVWVFHGVSLV